MWKPLHVTHYLQSRPTLNYHNYAHMFRRPYDTLLFLRTRSKYRSKGTIHMSRFFKLTSTRAVRFLNPTRPIFPLNFHLGKGACSSYFTLPRKHRHHGQYAFGVDRGSAETQKVFLFLVPRNKI